MAYIVRKHCFLHFTGNNKMAIQETVAVHDSFTSTSEFIFTFNILKLMSFMRWYLLACELNFIAYRESGSQITRQRIYPHTKGILFLYTVGLNPFPHKTTINCIQCFQRTSCLPHRQTFSKAVLKIGKDGIKPDTEVCEKSFVNCDATSNFMPTST